MEALDKWAGTQTLVFSVDIGTVQSAVSFVYLRANQTPEVKHVTGWPGESLQWAKTATAIYYDANATPRSFGAETQSDAVKKEASAQNWTLARSFKRYVHRMGGSAELSTDGIAPKVQPPPPLPTGVDEKRLYTDWMVFLFKYAKQAVVKEYSGTSWEVLSSNVQVIFTVPNGWYTQEQAILSQAAIASGFIANASKVRFVPETEAAVHWALYQGDLKPKAGADFIVCDSGGSTTDIAMYNVISNSPLKLREKEGNPSQCIEAGSALINDNFNNLVRNELADQDENDAEIVEAQERLADPFENLKANFSGSEATYDVYYDEEVTDDASDGKRIEVTRADMEALFDPVIDLIIPGIDYLLKNNKPQFLLLRGDFGYSPYFQKRLKSHYKDMKLIPASQQHVKAAAAGALVWYLKRSVVARAARFSFGQEIDVVYNPSDKEHVSRGAVHRPSGQRVPHGWTAVVHRGALLKDGEEHKRSFKRVYSRPDEHLGNFTSIVYLAEESVEKTNWLRDSQGKLIDGFRQICTVKADLSSQQGKLQKEQGPRGPYWSLVFEIAIAFGATALEARILWKENGVSRSGPAAVIPAEFE